MESHKSWEVMRRLNSCLYCGLSIISSKARNYSFLHCSNPVASLLAGAFLQQVKEFTSLFSTSRHAFPLQLQRIPRPPISNPFSFLPQISRITSISFSHTNGVFIFPSFASRSAKKTPNSGICLLPFFWFLKSLLNFIRLLHLRDFRFLRKRNRRKAPIREMITRSKLVEQLREYQIRSEHKWAALVIFSPKPQIITRYFCLCSLNFGYLFGSVYAWLMHSVMRGEELYLSTCREYEFCVNMCL